MVFRGICCVQWEPWLSLTNVMRRRDMNANGKRNSLYSRAGKDLPPLDCDDPRDAQWIRARNTANTIGIHALIQLLIDKGLITEEDLLRALSQKAEYEIDKRLFELNEDIARSDFFMHPGGAEAVEFMGQKASITQSDRVLEIGIGCGAEARQLYELFGCEIVGVERELLRICESILMTRAMGLDRRIIFKLGDAGNLPFEKEEFDIVWILGFPFGESDSNVFTNVISEAARVLKVSGRLAIACDTELASQIKDSGLQITFHDREYATKWASEYFGPEEHERNRMGDSMVVAVKQ